jgi:hypothetical protein
MRWTAPQERLFASPYRLTVYWGANGIGKSVALAELARRALNCELPWQTQGPQTVILAGNTWAQLGSTLKTLWATIDRSMFRKGIRYQGGGIKGQRLAIYDILAGPAAGGELRLGTFTAENLAGPRADVVITDEPLPRAVYDELWPRLLGRNGRMYQGFTPTISTSEDISYLWEMVDDPAMPWVGDIQVELSLDAVTPRGGLLSVPWMSAEEIRQFEQGVSGIERDMRMGRTRHPRPDVAYFAGWGPHLSRPMALADIPPGTPLGIGIDHGSRPGAQRAVLVAVLGQGIHSRVWVLDEYQGDGRTEAEEDAAGILSMLGRHGLTVEHIDRWVGDRAHGGYQGGNGAKSNQRLKAAIAQRLGLDVGARTGWSEKLPSGLRYMWTPRKYDRSVWEGCEILHRMMVGMSPRFSMADRCTHLAEDLLRWQGRKTDPHKDGIDALRYIVVDMVEGRGGR